MGERNSVRVSDIARLLEIGVEKDSFNNHFFVALDVLHVFNEFSVGNFLGISASSIVSTEKTWEFLVLDQAEIIEHSNELILCDKATLGSIVILERTLDEDSLATDHPPYICQKLIENLSFLLDRDMAALEELQIGAC